MDFLNTGLGESTEYTVHNTHWSRGKKTPIVLKLCFNEQTTSLTDNQELRKQRHEVMPSLSSLYPRQCRGSILSSM